MISRARIGAACLLAALLGAADAAAQAPPPLTPQGEIRLHLVPRRTTLLSTEIAAQIVELSVREGDTIQDGQRLVALDCAPYRARLARAEALLNRARRQADVQAQLDRQGATSKLEYDLALADVAAAEAEVTATRVPVGRCTIAAPFGGRVGELRVQRWQFAREGEPILEIIDDREMEVEMIVPSALIETMRPGTRFGAEIEETRKTYPVEIVRLAARIDPVSQTVKIFGRIVGRHPELLSGMSGRAVSAPAKQ